MLIEVEQTASLLYFGNLADCLTTDRCNRKEPKNVKKDYILYLNCDGTDSKYSCG